MKKQDRRKAQADKGQRSAERYQPGDRVWVSSTARGVSSKLAPKRDGPYEIFKEVSPASQLRSCDDSQQSLRPYPVCVE